MAQVSMTVRMDSQLKQMLDALCREIGMSANTAINVFARQMVNFGGIPFEIKADRKQSVGDMTAFDTLRAEAQQNGVQDMTLEEINEEIRQARAERRARKNNSSNKEAE